MSLPTSAAAQVVALLSGTKEAALFFHARRWVPVQVGYREKKPAAGPGWQNLRPTIDEIKRWPTCNVGVLLGTASGGLADIDLDCAQAVELAPYYLPVTWTFGRASKPRSHWIYNCVGAQSHAFSLGDGAERITMLEVRADTANGPGHQSVFPPSVHVTGEPISWDPEFADGTDGPLVIAWPDLMRQVASLARATVVRIEGASLDEARDFADNYRAPAPQQQLARHVARAAGDVAQRARAYVAKMSPAVSGSGGHEATYRVAIALVQGFELDDGTALEILRDFNERCAPPWSERELEHKVSSARKAAQVPSGYLLDDERRRA